ncbi:UNVERIFIED_CONTAM: Transcription factor [Sesamum calycinum]|uniref:Transcription factor n=1 Tax=Sesamum calycinum TaxID=2727403 RepID=A0AAW2J0V7_9LAMI
MRYLWMPRLVERIQAAAAAGAAASSTTATTTYHINNQSNTNLNMGHNQILLPQPNNIGGGVHTYTPENSSAAASSESFGTPVSDLTECYNNYPAVHNNNNQGNNQDYYPGNQQQQQQQLCYGDQSLNSPTAGYNFNQGLDFMEQNSEWMDGGDASDSLWNVDDMWFLQQQFNISNV